MVDLTKLDPGRYCIVLHSSKGKPMSAEKRGDGSWHFVDGTGWSIPIDADELILSAEPWPPSNESMRQQPKLHVMRETNLKDVPATLRSIADSIERGDIGRAIGCAVAVEADQFAVYYAGSGEAGPRTVLLLATAQAKIIQGVLEVFDA